MYHSVNYLTSFFHFIGKQSFEVGTAATHDDSVNGKSYFASIFPVHNYFCIAYRICFLLRKESKLGQLTMRHLVFSSTFFTSDKAEKRKHYGPTDRRTDTLLRTRTSRVRIRVTYGLTDGRIDGRTDRPSHRDAKAYMCV